MVYTFFELKNVLDGNYIVEAKNVEFFVFVFPLKS